MQTLSRMVSSIVVLTKASHVQDEACIMLTCCSVQASSRLLMVLARGQASCLQDDICTMQNVSVVPTLLACTSINIMMLLSSLDHVCTMQNKNMVQESSCTALTSPDANTMGSLDDITAFGQGFFTRGS